VRHRGRLPPRARRARRCSAGAIDGELDDRRVDEPLDRGDVVGVDAPAWQPRRDPSGARNGERPQVGRQ